MLQKRRASPSSTASGAAPVLASSMSMGSQLQEPCTPLGFYAICGAGSFAEDIARFSSLDKDGTRPPSASLDHARIKHVAA